MTVVRLKPKQTTVREGWQWTGQPREEWPSWVQKTVRKTLDDVEYRSGLRIQRRSGAIVLFPNEWLVRDLDSTDVIPYTEDELWKEFER